jgi:cytochrome c6
MKKRFTSEKRFAMAAAAILALVLISAVPAPQATAGGAAAGDAEAVYAKQCARCHGDDGRGETTMGKKFELKDLADPEVQALSDAEIRKIIADGAGKMPGFSKKLSAEEIDSLVKYVRKFRN